MRKDHIERMQDTAKQQEFISKDSVDRWALNNARSFPHAPDVQQAWEDLRSEVRAAHAEPLTEPNLDTAISMHVRESIPPFKDFQEAGRDLKATAQHISFGTDFTSHEVAQMVATDIAPDRAFIDALRTTANDEHGCQLIHAHAKQLDTIDRAMAASVQAQRTTQRSFPLPATAAVRNPPGPQGTQLPQRSTTTTQQAPGIER